MATEKKQLVPLEVVGGAEANAEAAASGSGQCQTSVNIAKICIGTGALALPRAANNGGLLVATVGLACMGLWNQLACERLEQLRRRHQVETYSVLVNTVFGSWARTLVDVCNISTLIGVCIVYQITFATLLGATPLALHMPWAVEDAPPSSSWRETLLAGAIVMPLACLPDISFLAKWSALGLAALAGGFMTMFVYGIASYHGGHCDVPVPMVPSSLGSFSQYFGVAAFCFGIPPLQFSIQESMSVPSKFTSALRGALMLVWAAYVICGVGIAYIYRCDEEGIKGNILQNLPLTSISAVVVRIAYALVCATSYPLTLVPVAGMIKPVMATLFNSAGRRTHVPLADAESGGTAVQDYAGEESPRERIILRASLVCVTTATALCVPQFDFIVSIVGSFSVSILSFVLPSAMYLRMLAVDEKGGPMPALSWRTIPDYILLVAGVGTCVITTALTIRNHH